MKLISISIGEGLSSANEWIVDKDGHGNDRLINKLSTQRIRVDKYVNISAKNSFTKRKSHKGTSSIYDLPADSHVVTSYINLNMNLVKTKKIDDSHKGDNLIYITISNTDYALMDYLILDDYEKIIQSFRKKDKFQGCVILFDKNKINIEDKFLPVILLNLWNIKTKKYEQKKIALEINDKGYIHDVSIETSEITDLISINDYHTTREKNTNYYHGFKISNTDRILTNTVITDDENLNDVDNLPESEACQNVIVVNKDTFKKDSDGNYSKDAEKLFDEYLTKKNVRAITVIGNNIRIQKDFCIKYKILYLFSYDLKTGINTCIKSI
jgi:hypothetical protein